MRREEPHTRRTFPTFGNVRRACFQCLELFPVLVLAAAFICSGKFEARAADPLPKADPHADAVAGLAATNAAELRCAAADYFRRIPQKADAATLAALTGMLADERRVILSGSGFAEGLPGAPAGEAEKALDAIGAPAVPQLRALATNAATPNVRERIARSLGRIADFAALPELVVLLADSNRAVSLAASDALAKLGTNAAPAVRKFLEPENPPNADRAIWVLGQLRDAESIPLLMRFVTSDDNRTRLAAGSTLASIGISGSRLLFDLWRDADEEGRLRIIPALDKLATPEARDHLLVTALADRSPKLRAAALRDMAAWKDTISPIALMCSVRDTDGANRDAAKKNFSQLGANAASLLMPYLDDNNPAVWQAAALSLAAMSKEAAPPLFDSLRDPSRTREAKQRTAWVLMNLGELKATYEESQRLWIAADDWQMLGIFTEGIPAPIAEAAASTYASQRSGALRTMSVLKLRGMETFLLRGLDDPDPDVVQTARRGLAEQGYAFASQLETVVQRGSVRASRAAAQTLTDIDFRPRTQALSIEFFASRGAVDRLLELGGSVPTHLQRRLERCTEPAEIARLALDLATVLPMITPDERFAVDNVMVRGAFLGTNRTARIAAARELSGRANLLLALALDGDTNVSASASAHLAALPGNARELLAACLRSGNDRLREAAFTALARTEPAQLSAFEWMLRESDATLVRRCASLFAARGHEPSDVAARAAVAVQNRDWPRVEALGTPAFPALRSFIETAPTSELSPLFDMLAASSQPAFVDLLVDASVLRDPSRFETAWPAIQRVAKQLEPRLLKLLRDGDLNSANLAAFVLARTERVPDDRTPDFMLFCAAAGLTHELDDQRQEAEKVFLREMRREDPALRLRGAVWLTLLQREPDKESIFSIGGLVRSYIQRLDHGEPVARAEAAVLLSQLGTNAAPAVPALVRALGDNTQLPYRSGIVARDAVETPAQAAAFALGKIGEPSVAALLTAWDSPDTPDDARGAAAYGLAMLRDPRCARVHLLLIEKDRRLTVRMEAIRSLAASDPKAAIKPILKILTQNREVLMLGAASEALRSIGPEVNPVLVLALYDEDSTVQETALLALTNRREPSAFEAAQRLARGPYATVRSQAAKYFGSISLPQAVPALIELLGDRSTIVQWNAAEALTRYGLPAARAMIERMPTANAELRESMEPILRSITGVDFGTDPAAWQAWWKQNGTTP